MRGRSGAWWRNELEELAFVASHEAHLRSPTFSLDPIIIVEIIPASVRTQVVGNPRERFNPTGDQLMLGKGCINGVLRRSS